ncbi:MAG: 4-alpha-glucanotransferase [Rheinheimera sp.]|nr:4-alpha-glucanotransferase [Rheinheimera sp.]
MGKLVAHLAKQGADFVGLNPIHALYPAMPESASPYSPSSRRWLNLIYLSVPQMPGLPAVSANSSAGAGTWVCPANLLNNGAKTGLITAGDATETTGAENLVSLVRLSIRAELA